HRIGYRRETIGGMDHRLRRDAAADQASAAEPVLLDQHGVEAELAGADRGDIAAHAAADHQHAWAQGFSHGLHRTTPPHSRRKPGPTPQLLRHVMSGSGLPPGMRYLI